MMRYAFTPYALPALACAVVLALLAIHVLRRRSMPAAVPLARLLLVGIPWTLGHVLELSAVEPATKISWFRWQGVWYLPLATAGLLFAIEYANLGHWLKRWTMVLLALPIVVVAALMMQPPGPHHALWLEMRIDHGVHAVRATTFWIVAAYGYLLGLGTALVFVWLLFRSPLQRRAAAVCLVGVVIVRVAYLVDVSGMGRLPMRTAPVAMAVAAVLYAVALYRFGMLDAISVARRTVIDQMRDGVLVVDPQGRVLDANRAAERMLQRRLAHIVGREATRFLPPEPGLEAMLLAPEHVSIDLRMEGEGGVRQYAMRRTTLEDRRGLSMGNLLLFRDVTERRRTQQQVLDQQRALATSQERERMGRELHDGLGQVLGYLKMQMQAARELLAQSRWSEVDRLLEQGSAVAQDAHADVREHILGARIGAHPDDGLLDALGAYLRQFSAHYGITTELTVAPDLDAGRLEPTGSLQMLRVIQEGLTNARKHGRAQRAYVRLGVYNGVVQATVEDDGVGFDPASLTGLGERRFGLTFMRERAESVGGTVRIDSAPGAGTRITVSVPLREVQS